MATINTAIRITDGMAPAFRSINNSLNMVISSFENLQRTSSNPIDISSLAHARAELNKAEVAIYQIEEQISKATLSQERFNRSNNNLNNGFKSTLGTIGKIASVQAVIKGVGELIKMYDDYSANLAKLNIINDGLQSTDNLF